MNLSAILGFVGAAMIVAGVTSCALESRAGGFSASRDAPAAAQPVAPAGRVVLAHAEFASLTASAGASEKSDGLRSEPRHFVPVHDAPTGWSYPTSCCSGYDCRQVNGAGSAVRIEERPEGYVVSTTGEIIPMLDRKVKPSPDGEFHWCSKGGRDDSATICLFVPPRGF